MRRAAVLVVCVGSALAVWGTAPARGAAEPAAALAPAPSPDPGFVPWVPSESWPGGRQHDPRLERTVEFWRAGIPLREVFAGVREQTGVEIGFWPPGDMNERVCVTLYLSPENAPTLRELMAQLSWVTDCAFAHRLVDGEVVYHLMRTSIGEGVIERLLEERRATAEERDAKQREETAALKQRVLDVLEECRTAVWLPQAELVKQYRGVNDALQGTSQGMVDTLSYRDIHTQCRLTRMEYSRWERGGGHTALT